MELNLTPEDVRAASSSAGGLRQLQHGSGYKGRMALFEIMTLDDEMRDLIMKKPAPRAARPRPQARHADAARVRPAGDLRRPDDHRRGGARDDHGRMTRVSGGGEPRGRGGGGVPGRENGRTRDGLQACPCTDRWPGWRNGFMATFTVRGAERRRQAPEGHDRGQLQRRGDPAHQGAGLLPDLRARAEGQEVGDRRAAREAKPKKKKKGGASASAGEGQAADALHPPACRRCRTRACRCCGRCRSSRASRSRACSRTP
jgi:hypothetical protein